MPESGSLQTGNLPVKIYLANPRTGNLLDNLEKWIWQLDWLSGDVICVRLETELILLI